MVATTVKAMTNALTKNIRAQFAAWVRKTFERRGFVLLRPEYRFGIDPFVDVRRIAALRGIVIDNVFDVGANDGETALSLTQQFPHAKITSFEPHPRTFSKLTARLGKNPNLTAVNVALGSVNQTLQLSDRDNDKFNSFVYSDPGASAIPVACTTIDSYCAANHVERIGFLKIDAEGFDLEVVRGASTMLARHAIDFVYFEFNQLRTQGGHNDLLPIYDLLEPAGFHFVATYLDYVEVAADKFFIVSNALFFLSDNKRLVSLL
jgi:FkbM family methyltransferase